MTDALKVAIVEELGRHFAPGSVARSFGVSYECYRQYLRKDPEFRAAVDEAREFYAESLRIEVHRRAVEGWDEPVFYNGVQCGVVRRYSDALLLRHVARFDPSYRATVSVEQRAPGREHWLSGYPIAKLSAEARVALAAVLQAEREARARRGASEAPADGTTVAPVSAERARFVSRSS